MRNYILKIFALLAFIFSVSTARAVDANFTVDHISGCSPLVVSFTNTSTGASSYDWDLGNGTTSGLTNVSGSYITPGTYTVTLTAHSGSTTSTHTITITVFASPVPSFIASDTSVCPGTGVTFTSTSSPGVPGPLTYIWNFGDGFTSTSATPTHIYATPGFYNVTLSLTNSQGCVTTTTVSGYIHVFNHSSPAFSASPTYFCVAPGHAVFTNGTTGTGAFTYTWSFGDGGTSTAANPTHDYMSTGTYTVKLYVVDGNGCTDSIIRLNYITVATLNAAFIPVTSACVFNTVTFYNASGPHSTSSWSFGDGGTATTDTGRHVYSAPGSYIVRLIIYNGFCYDTATSTVNILPQPTGTFTTSPTTSCPAPATINFVATAPGSTVAWFYGDGGTGTGSSSSHTYGSNGVYNVQMVITNANGCKDTISQTVTINDLNFDIYAASPVSASGCVPLTVAFGSTVGTTIPAPGYYPVPITSYTWSYGDGSATTVAGPSPSHTFTAVGVYSVICTIVTSNGCIRRDTMTVSVGAPPVVTFTAMPTHVCYHKPVTFNAHIVSGPVDVYSWTWGDGATQIDSFPNTSHVFATPGLFTVTLVAFYHGCPSLPYTWTDSFRVDSPMAVIASTYHCDPYTRVTFIDNSLGDDAPLWLFGDGGTSTSDTPNHIYPAPGIYTATLTTYNVHSGCRDTARVTLNLVPPVLTMHVNDTTICSGDTIHFTPTVTGSTAVSNYWDVNGVCLDVDTSANFNYWFPTAGLYTIRYRIRDLHGCFDTVTRSNWILSSHPVANFTSVPPIGCAPLSVLFTDASTPTTGTYLTNYKWGFGDASSTSTASVTVPTISHVYTAAGTFSIKEIITDNIGCKDSITLPSVTVWRPHAAFVASTTFPCINSSVHFTNTSVGTTSAFWMFGDGDTTSVISPNHVYLNYGVYTVKLVVTDGHGCPDTAVYTGYITVAKPAAHFHMDDSFSICPPLPVHFFNTSTGAVSYGWNFGDGGTSISTSPGDLYTTAGTFTVTLVATDAHGCRDTALGHVIIYGSAGGFAYTPLTGCAPLAVHFNASLSNVPNITWDFADGNTFATSMSDSTTHVYVNPGSYVPKLILSDNTGCQSSSLGVDTIKVDAVRPGFNTNPNPICINSNVTYLDTSGSYFSTISSWHWVFGPGDTSNLAGPTHFYNTAGSFPVTLIVTDGWGCTGAVTKNVTVHPPPTIDAGPDTTVCVGDPATLTATGGTIYNWAPTPVSCNPCQTTQASPTVVTTYTVTGTDAFGCVNTDTVTVHLRTLTISGGWGDAEVCRKTPVPLFDTGGTKYTWIPAAGLSSSTIWNPIATPDTTTNYMVIAQLGSCIPDTNYVNVIIHQLPTVDAGPDQTLVAGSHAQINAVGTLMDHFLWTPGNLLSCDSCADPIANNFSTQTYTITVSTNFGCKASDSVTIYLFCDASQIFIPNTFTPNGDGQNDVFFPRGSGISKIKAFRIYNRWGELLFERTNLNINDVSNAWDGSFKGGPPRPDVYVYLVDAQCDTGEPIFIKGDVTLVK